MIVRALAARIREIRAAACEFRHIRPSPGNSRDRPRHDGDPAAVARRHGKPGGGRGTAGPAVPGVADGYGRSRLIRVPQFARAVRVAPQLPIGGVTYWASVHVCPMYSEAIQMLLPSTTAAP